MRTFTIKGQYEIAEAIARIVREMSIVIGEITIGKKEPEAQVIKRLYIDNEKSYRR